MIFFPNCEFFFVIFFHNANFKYDFFLKIDVKMRFFPKCRFSFNVKFSTFLDFFQYDIFNFFYRKSSGFLLHWQHRKLRWRSHWPTRIPSQEQNLHHRMLVPLRDHHSRQRWSCRRSWSRTHRLTFHWHFGVLLRCQKDPRKTNVCLRSENFFCITTSTVVS